MQFSYCIWYLCKAIEEFVFDNADLYLVMIANRITFRLLSFPSLSF